MSNNRDLKIDCLNEADKNPEKMDLQNRAHIRELIKALSILKKAELYCDGFRKLLSEQDPKNVVDFAKKISQFRVFCIQQKPFLIQHPQYLNKIILALKATNHWAIWIKFLPEHVQHIDKLANELVKLSNMNLLSNENQLLLTEHAENCKYLADALIELHKHGLLSKKNRILLGQHAQYATWLARAMTTLHKAGLLSPENQALLIKGASQYIEDIALAFIELNQHMLLSIENKKLLIKYTHNYPYMLASGFLALDRHHLLTHKNKKLLGKHIKNAHAISKILDRFSEMQITINQEDFLSLLRQDIKNLFSLMIIANEFKQAGISPEKHLDTLKHQTSQSPYFFLQGFKWLTQTKLLTDENLTLLIKWGKFIDHTVIVAIFIELRRENLFSSHHKQMLIRHLSHINNVESVNPVHFDHIMQLIEDMMNNAYFDEVANLRIKDVMSQEGGHYARDVAFAMVSLRELNLIKDSWMNLFLDQVYQTLLSHYGSPHAKDISCVPTKSSCLSATRQALRSWGFDGRYAKQMTFASAELFRAGLDADNHNAFLRREGGRYAREIAFAIIELANTKIFSETNLTFLCNSGLQFVEDVALVLVLLHVSGLANQKNYETLLSYREFCDEIASNLFDKPRIDQAALDDILLRCRKRASISTRWINGFFSKRSLYHDAAVVPEILDFLPKLNRLIDTKVLTVLNAKR